MKETDIDHAIQDLLDGNIQPPALAELESELRNNPDACARYSELVHIHNALQLRSTASKQLPTKEVIPMDHIIRKQKIRSLRTAALSAAAIILLTFLGLQFIQIQQKAPAISFETSPNTEFTLTHARPESELPTTTLEVGSRLQLAQGSVELTFENGVKSLILAPADITLLDDNALSMPLGCAWFHVPPEAVGFTVTSDQLKVVDLGTQFGILAGPNRADEVHVFKGSVLASSTQDISSAYTLKAPEARRSTARGFLETIPAAPEAFLTTLPETFPHIRWTFDGENPFQATGSHPDAAHIQTKVHGSPAIVSGHTGNAIKLNGIDEYLESDWQGFSGLRPRTVSTWVKVSSEDALVNNASLIGWGVKHSPLGKWSINISQPNNYQRLNLSFGSTWVSTSLPVPRDRWVHLAIATDGILIDDKFLSIDLYLDGQKETTRVTKSFKDNFGTLTQSKKSVPLLIGASLHHLAKNRKFLKATIDEIRIYDGYLSEQEILKLDR